MKKDAQTRTDTKQKSPKTQRQDAFLGQYKNSLYNITRACKASNIARRTFYSWLEKDPKFKEKYEEAQEERLDFLEDALFKKVKQGHLIAIIFSLKCLGRKRGWEEESTLKIKPVIGTLDKRTLDAAVQAGIESEIMSRQLRIGVNDE